MGLPACPRHPESLVRLYGTYGSHGRARQRTVDGFCAECERGFGRHEGHQSPRTFSFSVLDVAKTLVRVGAGASYRTAGREIRRDTGRVRELPDRRYVYTSAEPNLVEDWVEVFAPRIFERFAVSTWPEQIVLDHIPFHIRERAFGKPKRSGKLAFCVLGAVGYVGDSSFVVRLEAAPSPSRASWERFLRALKGQPERIVTDEAPGILKAIPRVWAGGEESQGPTVALCE